MFYGFVVFPCFRKQDFLGFVLFRFVLGVFVTRDVFFSNEILLWDRWISITLSLEQKYEGFCSNNISLNSRQPLRRNSLLHVWSQSWHIILDVFTHTSSMFSCMCGRACPCSRTSLWNLYFRQGRLNVPHSESCSSLSHRAFLSCQWPAYCYDIIMWFTCIFSLIQLP